MSAIGIVSGQRVKRSMHVSMYEQLFDEGSGPMCTLSKRARGTAKVDSGVKVCKAGSGPPPDICIDTGPYISSCYKTLRSYSWVGDTM